MLVIFKRFRKVRRIGAISSKETLRDTSRFDLDHPYRLIFKPNEPVPLLEDGGIDLKSITAITIVRVEDYHD